MNGDAAGRSDEQELRDRRMVHETQMLFMLYRPRFPKGFFPSDFMLVEPKSTTSSSTTPDASASSSGSGSSETSTFQTPSASSSNASADKKPFFPNGKPWTEEGEDGERPDRETLVQEALAREPIPDDQKWYRQGDWIDTRRKLVAMAKSGKFEPCIKKERKRPDGTVTEVSVPIWKLWPDQETLQTSLTANITEQDTREILHLKKLKEIVGGALAKQFNDKFLNVLRRHNPTSFAERLAELGGEAPEDDSHDLSYAYAPARPERPRTPEPAPAPGPAPEPVQRRQQAPLNRNERRAAQRRQQRKS